MRKAFNFYNSYFEVAKELNDKDRLAFYDALITRQFTGVELELKGMAKFAYISQKFNIDAQVLGYETKTKTTLGGSVGGGVGGSVQEKEKEKEKEKEQIVIDVDAFLNWFNEMKLKYVGTKGKFTSINKTTINNLTKLKQQKLLSNEWEHAFEMMCLNDWVVENQMQTPSHFLVNDNFFRYLNQKPKNKEPEQDEFMKNVYKQINLNK